MMKLSLEQVSQINGGTNPDEEWEGKLEKGDIEVRGPWYFEDRDKWCVSFWEGVKEVSQMCFKEKWEARQYRIFLRMRYMC